MRACPSCGHENPDAARFCNACGSPLAAAAPGRREERKVVTVLFADLVGFTARAEQLDPEDVRALLSRYHAQLRTELERFGGTVEKFIGDAVMALFGAPVAHEDDPDRAVRAALAIRDWVAEQGAELQTRIGINTGEVVVTLGTAPAEGEGMAAGDVVNTAARLQAAAPVNGILVGEATYRATRQAIDYHVAAAVEAKGKTEPIPVWEPVQARSRVGVDIAQLSRAPLIGRDSELGVLRDALARARSQRSVQLVTLVGVPGIGKSRLVFELMRAAESETEMTTWRQGRSLPYGERLSFWALGEIVKAEAGILESDRPEEAERKLEHAVAPLAPDAAEARWLARHLGMLIGVGDETPPTSSLPESFAAWRGFLETLADQRPLVLVFEDLHWADEGLLDFVDQLVERATRVPLLVLCTTRPELLERRPGWGGGKPNAVTLSMTPLADPDTARLIASLVERPVMPADLQDDLLDRAGGNPLYAEQYARMLLERGAVEAIPETVQGIVAARLDALSPDQKELLQNGAVVGKVFWLGAAVQMGDGPRREAEEVLHALERKEFVERARRSSVAGEPEYTFRHVLLRDVAYGQIPRAARAQKHALAATWIESLSRPEDHAEMLADHYSRALEYGRAAGAAALSDIEDKAARYLVLAGDRTFPLDAAKADAYYARALELLPERGPARADVLAKRGETSRLAARPLEAERLYEQAIDAFRARGDLVGAARTMVKLAVAVWDRGETARARELRQHAVELLEREQPGPELARAYAATAGGFMTAGSARDSLTWAEKALPLAERFGVDDLSVRVPQFRGVARWDLGDVGGLDDLRDALRLGLELGLGFETSTAYINLAHFLWLTDGPAQALEVERAGIDFAQRRGMPGQAMWAEQEMLWFLFDLGEWDELRVLADDLIERDRARGGSQVGATALIFKAQVLFHRGRLDEAAALYEEFLPRAREIGDLQVLTPALATAALVEQTRGDAVRAVSLVDELGDASRDRNPWHRIRYAADAARVLVAAGHHDVGEHLSLDDRGVIGARSLTSLLTVRAVTAEAGGDLQHALDLYCDAAQRWTDYGFALERGQALLGAARCLVALERRPDAVPALAEARETFAQLQATPLVAESDGVLGQAAQAESPVASDTSGV